MKGRSSDLLLLLISLLITRFFLLPAFESYQRTKQKIEELKDEMELVKMEKKSIPAFISQIKEIKSILRNIKYFDFSSITFDILQKEKLNSKLVCVEERDCFVLEEVSLIAETSYFPYFLFMFLEMRKINFAVSPEELKISRLKGREKNKLVIHGRFKMMYHHR